MLIKYITKDIIIIESTLNSYLEILKDEFYQYLECSIKVTKNQEPYYTFKYISEKADRELNLSYFPLHSELSNYFSVTINTYNRKKSVKLIDLIKENKYEISDGSFSLDTYEGNKQQKVQQFIIALNDILSKYFNSIIKGNDWKEVM